MIQRIRGPRFAAVLLAMTSLALPMAAAPGDDSDKTPAKAEAPAPSEIEQLKKMLIEQQQQINELRRMLLDQKGSSDTAAAHPAVVNQEVGKSLGEVASTTPSVPPAPVAPPTPILPPAVAAAPPQGDQGTSPLQLKLGDAYITPVGFMDMTIGLPLDQPRNVASAPISAASRTATPRRGA